MKCFLPELAQLCDPLLTQATLVCPVTQCVADDFAARGVFAGGNGATDNGHHLWRQGDTDLFGSGHRNPNWQSRNNSYQDNKNGRLWQSENCDTSLIFSFRRKREAALANQETLRCHANHVIAFQSRVPICRQIIASLPMGRLPRHSQKAMWSRNYSSDWR